jgi:hypothetical protein
LFFRIGGEIAILANSLKKIEEIANFPPFIYQPSCTPFINFIIYLLLILNKIIGAVYSYWNDAV